MRSSPKPPDNDGKRKAGEDAEEGEEPRLDISEHGGGPWETAGARTIEEDPLALIRREIAIMKKLE